MQDLNDLYYFVETVNHGGFSPASRVLGVAKSKLSRRIAILEERLGVRLIQRSTRHFSVTEIGHQYYEHCKAMLVEAEAAQEVIDSMRTTPRGVIRMTCPDALLQIHVGQMIADFMTNCPEITVYLEASNRRVDLVSEGIDLAIRVRPTPLEDSDLVMRVLAERRQCLVASPALVNSHGQVHSPSALNDWPSLAQGFPKQNHCWTLYNSDMEQVKIFHKPRLVTTDMVTLRKAAISGVGLVQLPLLMIQTYLTSGELVSVLPAWEPKREIIHAVFPTKRGLLPSVRLLVDYLAQCFAAIDEE